MIVLELSSYPPCTLYKDATSTKTMIDDHSNGVTVFFIREQKGSHVGLSYIR
jgi:hypothetical protein